MVRLYPKMGGLLSLVVVLVSAAITSKAAPTPNVEVTDTNTAMMYLSRFGYMDPSATELGSIQPLSEEAIQKSVIDFQRFAGLSQTGALDPATKEKMNMPRCGNPDFIRPGANTRRRKRNTLQGSSWEERELTYKITKYPSWLDRKAVDREIAAAFQVWENVSNLTFVAATTGKEQIEIRFEEGEHGDSNPFDDSGRILAHAFFPKYGSDAHFDDAELWTIDSYSGINLFQVAVHEFGHSSGLDHSNVRSAVMAPFYEGYESNFKLDIDDIKAIQALYGKKDTTWTLPGTPGFLCHDSKIDVIVTTVDQNTYVFKGSQYWLLTRVSTAPGYPKMITANWDGLPGNLDAAFTCDKGKTYFFKGSRYWRMSNMKMDPNYPKPINEGFDGIPNDIDAVVVWSGNGKIYFFKDDNYWRFEPTERPVPDPRAISVWEGVPNNVDDAFPHNGFTYFFKGDQYWRYNDKTERVDTAVPPFPRSVRYGWFGCFASTAHTKDLCEIPETSGGK